jgi:hypothetical protein
LTSTIPTTNRLKPNAVITSLYVTSVEEGHPIGIIAAAERHAYRLQSGRPVSAEAADGWLIHAYASRGNYFFLLEPKLGCHPAAFWLGAAAIVLIFSFLGFLDSRLPFCSPLAMPISLSLMTTLQFEHRLSH